MLWRRGRGQDEEMRFSGERTLIAWFHATKRRVQKSPPCERPRMPLASKLGACKIVKANLAHIRQTGPECGPGFGAKVLKVFEFVPSLLGSGGG